MTEPIKIIIPADPQALEAADQLFIALARIATSDSRKGYHIRTILSEAVCNAYLHGRHGLDGTAITVEARFNRARFSAMIINEGEGITDNLIDWHKFPPGLAESGRGLKIIKRLADKVEFKRLAENKFGVYFEINLKEGETIKY